MLAENVDHAGNALGIDVDAAYRLGLKYGITIGSGDAKSLADIAVSLFQRERGCPAADGDALAKLTEFVTLELDLELRLTREDDLQELLARGFEIQKKPDFLKGGGIQALGFIDDQYRSLSRPIALQQPGLEGQQLFTLAVRRARYRKIVEDEIEQVLWLDVRVENESGRHLLLGKPVEQTPDEDCFAGAYFAS